MGNQSSNNGESKNESIKNSNDISIYYLENLSIYKGMKTESNSNAKSDSCSTDKATTSTSIPDKRTGGDCIESCEDIRYAVVCC